MTWYTAMSRNNLTIDEKDEEGLHYTNPERLSDMCTNRVLERVHVWNSLNGLGIFDCQFDTASSHWEGNCIDQIGQLARLAG